MTDTIVDRESEKPLSDRDTTPMDVLDIDTVQPVDDSYPGEQDQTMAEKLEALERKYKVSNK